MNDPRAGQPASPLDLVDVAHLVTAYYTGIPDPSDPEQRVAFGTSGHRGSSLRNAFNETHIVATTQAICDYRKAKGYNGPLFLGRDTHGLSEPAWVSAIEVLAANDVTLLVDDRGGYTPTPAVSHAILRANRGNVPRWWQAERRSPARDEGRNQEAQRLLTTRARALGRRRYARRSCTRPGRRAA